MQKQTNITRRAPPPRMRMARPKSEAKNSLLRGEVALNEERRVRLRCIGSNRWSMVDENPTCITDGTFALADSVPFQSHLIRLTIWCSSFFLVLLFFFKKESWKNCFVDKKIFRITVVLRKK